MNRRRVCTVLVDRANYGRLKPVMAAVQSKPSLELQVIAAGTMVLERFDKPVDGVRRDGFPIDGEIHIELEGSMPITMAKSVGFGVIEFASEFQRLKPDIVLLIGDRYEALAATVAAAYMNLTIVHLQGGEVSGSIDESARHAMTKFSHYHYPSTARAKEYILRMGESPDSVLGVGCPSSDLARVMPPIQLQETLNRRGSGATIDTDAPFLLAVFHPTTTEFGGEASQMRSLLEALDEIGEPTLLLWPNIDAGSNHISKTIRVFRDERPCTWLRTLTNLTPEDYLQVLAHAACCVGNSSSFVRDASFFGTPVVLVGNRQRHREHDEHVTPVPVDPNDIAKAIRSQLDHGRYPPSALYGDGHVSQRVAEALERIELRIQKHLAFPVSP